MDKGSAQNSRQRRKKAATTLLPILVSANPEREQLEARLTLRIYRIIKSRGLT